MINIFQAAGHVDMQLSIMSEYMYIKKWKSVILKVCFANIAEIVVPKYIGSIKDPIPKDPVLSDYSATARCQHL